MGCAWVSDTVGVTWATSDRVVIVDQSQSTPRHLTVSSEATVTPSATVKTAEGTKYVETSSGPCHHFEVGAVT